MKINLALCLNLLLSVSAEAQVRPLPPDFTLFGKMAGDYGAEFFQFSYNLSTNGNYLLPAAGPWGNEPVYFLQRAFPYVPVPGVQNYFIPDNVYVFFPIVAYEGDNVDSIPPYTIPQLRDANTEIINSVTELHAIIDGVPLTNLFDYRASSPVFSIYLKTNDNLYTVFLGHPIDGLIDPVVAEGYFLMLPPLPAGVHTFNTGATLGPPNDVSFDRHYQINVFPANHPPLSDASATDLRVISPDHLNAKVLLDGSRSSDPDNDPLTYTWVEGGVVIGSGALSTNLLPVGEHVIHLVVSDGELSATNTLTMQVQTPGAALDALAGAVEAAHLTRRQTRPLEEELQEASAAFEHGFRFRHHDRQEHVKHAIHELLEFEHDVREGLVRANPALAALLIEAAQDIIDAVKLPSTRHRGEEDEDKTPPELGKPNELVPKTRNPH